MKTFQEIRRIMILYLAADLIWGTRVRSVGDGLGIPMRPARSLEMLEARLADSPVKAVLLDLETGDTAMQMIERLRGPNASDADRGVRIVAWGPHVLVDLLHAAKAAGADVVMARGAFSARLMDLLPALENAPAKGDGSAPAASDALADQLEDEPS